MVPTPVLARDVYVTMFRDDCKDPKNPNTLGLAHVWNTPHFTAAFMELIMLQYAKDQEYYDGITTQRERGKIRDMYEYFWDKYKDYAIFEQDCTTNTVKSFDLTKIDAFKENIAKWHEYGTRIPPRAYLSRSKDSDKYILKDGKDRFAFLCAQFAVLTGVNPENFRVLLTIEPGQLTSSNGSHWTSSRFILNKQFNLTTLTQRFIDSRQYEPPDSGLDKNFPEPFYAVLGHGCLIGDLCPLQGRFAATKRVVPADRTIVFVTLPGGVAYQEAHLRSEFVQGLRARRMTKTYRGTYFVVYEEGETYCDSEVQFYDDANDSKLGKYGIYRYPGPGAARHTLVPDYVPKNTDTIKTTIHDIISQKPGTYVFETCRVTKYSNVAKDARNANRAALYPGTSQERRLSEIESDPMRPRRAAMLQSVDDFKSRGIVDPKKLKPSILRRYSSMRIDALGNTF